MIEREVNLKRRSYRHATRLNINSALLNTLINDLNKYKRHSYQLCQLKYLEKYIETISSRKNKTFQMSGIKMVEEKDPELTSPNKHNETTTAYRATLVENDQKTSRIALLPRL